MSSRQERSGDLGLLLIRAFLGLILIINSWAAVERHEPTAREFRSVVEAGAKDAPGPMRWIGESILAAQPEVFATIVRYGGLLAGVLLLFGGLVRPVGWLAGSAFLLAYFLGRPAQEHWYLMAAVSCIACAISSAGHIYGLDRSLDRALPRWLTWSDAQGGSKKSPFA